MLTEGSTLPTCADRALQRNHFRTADQRPLAIQSTKPAAAERSSSPAEERESLAPRARTRRPTGPGLTEQTKPAELVYFVFPSG